MVSITGSPVVQLKQSLLFLATYHVVVVAQRSMFLIVLLYRDLPVPFVDHTSLRSTDRKASTKHPTLSNLVTLLKRGMQELMAATTLEQHSCCAGDIGHLSSSKQ